MALQRAKYTVQRNRGITVQRKSQTVVKLAISRLDLVKVSPKQTIENALRQLNDAGTGALLLCEGDTCEFCGLLTDGDIRRGFLRGLTFQEPCCKVATRKPLVATVNQSTVEMLQLMNNADINHLPLVDGQGNALGLILRQDLDSGDHSPMSAVIMAGGLGTRLMPLTTDTPKPMLPVGDRPLMEHTIERLRKAGIRHVNITTHHLSEKISQYFQDGSQFGVEVTYVNEENPMGTAGGLSFISQRTEPILVVNGDILTTVRFRELLAFHRENRADLTVGVRTHELDVPYGVVECDGAQVKNLQEKPTIRLLVNAGVYVLQPFVSYFIPTGRRCDMTDLIKILLESGRKVVSFPIMEYWRDIGQRIDYENANEDVRMGRV
jgi:dTDP-glucose pyrophosphorylase/CBS domain-containing protein